MTPKTLAEIVSELQTVDQTTLENAVAGLNAAIADLQAFVPAAGPVVSVTTTTQTSATATFVPQA